MFAYRLLFIIVLIGVCHNILSQQLAFPGAEGFGQYAKGGRGGLVLIVNNLEDSGPGSLRDALTSSAYKGKKRTIIFTVSGNIELQSSIEIQDDSCITIAGQTAPGDGICIKNFPLKIGDSRDIIIRYLRLRIGDEQDCGTGCDELDALSFRKCYNIILDHCSLSWSIDAVLDLTVLTGYSTVQWCILHEPLNNSKHSKGAHSYIAGWDGNSYGGGTVFGGGSYHHNLLASGGSRTPRLDKYAGDNGKRDLIDIVNNVIYNWSGYGAYGGEAADVNWQNNYHRYGPSTSNRSQIFLPGDTCRMYVNGNYVDGYPDVTADNSKGISASPLLTVDEILQNVPYPVWSVDMQTAGDAFNAVLWHAGAFVPNRDSCDIRIVNDVINRTGKIIDSQSEVGGWPVLNSKPGPADTDLDGMPDAWEEARGLNKNSDVDRNILSENGYTELEVYLNSIEFQKPVQNISYQFDRNGSLTIRWDDTYLGEDSFCIERSVNGTAYEIMTCVPKNTTSYTDTDSMQVQGIRYRVVAVQQGVTDSPEPEIIAATGLALQIDDTIHKGDTVNIDIVFEPDNATNRLIKWELIQQPDNIAEFIEPGRLIARQAGEITITAELTDGSHIMTSKNVVVADPVSSTDSESRLLLNDYVSVFPNPSSDGRFFITIDPELTGALKVIVFDITGKTEYEVYIHDKGNVLLKHRFDNGIYFMNFVSEHYNSIKRLVVNSY